MSKTAQIVRQIADLALCDERSARKFLLGEPLKPKTQERVRRAAAQLGVAPVAVNVNGEGRVSP